MHMGKLTAIKVKNAKPGRHADGDGLFLYVKESGARTFVLRVQYQGNRRDIGLGTADVDSSGRDAFGAHNPLDATSLMLRKSLTLAEAREKAAALRKLAKAGADPVAERDKERRVIPTFAEAVISTHKALAPGLAEKNAKAFLASLQEHAIPKLGKLTVDAIGAPEILLALAPIWTDKPVMAKKVRARIVQVLAFAKAQGWRTEALPDAREMKSGLSRQARGGNFAAMPFAEVPDFFADQLGKGQSASRNALMFAILTAARSGEVRQARWEQIDLEAGTWSRPADMMKMKDAHVVTLSNAAIALLERLAPEDARKGLVFPGTKGGPLSDMSLTKIMRLAHRTETVHGFRSAFRVWAAEKMPTIPAMVPEMALAHRVGTSTEQAYLRTDLRDMRRTLMDAWGIFVAPSLSGVGGNDNVVALMAAKA